MFEATPSTCISLPGNTEGSYLEMSTVENPLFLTWLPVSSCAAAYCLSVDFSDARHVATSGSRFPALIRSLSTAFLPPSLAWETRLPSFIYSRGQNVASHYGPTTGFNTLSSSRPALLRGRVWRTECIYIPREERLGRRQVQHALQNIAEKQRGDIEMYNNCRRKSFENENVLHTHSEIIQDIWKFFHIFHIFSKAIGNWICRNVASSLYETK